MCRALSDRYISWQETRLLPGSHRAVRHRGMSLSFTTPAIRSSKRMAGLNNSGGRRWHHVGYLGSCGA